MARFAVCFVTLLSVAAISVQTAPDGTAASTLPGQDRDHQQKPRSDRDSDGRPRDRWKWWLYDRTELGINDRQSAEIDRIFEETIPHQRAKREELERLEAVLATMTREAKADVSAVAQQVNKVESLRAEMNKTRTVMLYRINLVLSAEQREKLKVFMEKRDAERRRNDADRRKDDNSPRRP
jgi:Spy/CpxP family protein refolding chaperone